MTRFEHYSWTHDVVLLNIDLDVTNSCLIPLSTQTPPDYSSCSRYPKESFIQYATQT
jgi:hypothetical protein